MMDCDLSSQGRCGHTKFGRTAFKTVRNARVEIAFHTSVAAGDKSHPAQVRNVRFVRKAVTGIARMLQYGPTSASGSAAGSIG